MADKQVYYIVDGKTVDPFGNPVEVKAEQKQAQSGQDDQKQEGQQDAQQRNGQKQEGQQNTQGDTLTAESYEKLNAKDVVEGLSSGKYEARQVREFEGQRSEPRKTVMEALEAKEEE